MDRDFSGRIAFGPPYYWPSYSLDTVVDPNGASRGIGTAFPNFTTAAYFKSTQIKNPANKMMLAEEPSLTTPAEFPPNWPNNGIIDDGHWEPVSGNLQVNNTLTMRHNKKANVNFADGHAQSTSYLEATNLLNVVATY